MCPVERLHQSPHVAYSGCNHKTMKDLVACAHKIVSPGAPSLRYSACINGRTDDIKHSLQEHPSQAHPLINVFQRIQFQCMKYGDNARNTHTYEERRTDWAVLRRTESRVECCIRNEKANRAHLQHIVKSYERVIPQKEIFVSAYHSPIQQYQVLMAVESVIYRWNCRSKNRNHDSEIVQLISKPRHRNRVIGNGMVRRRKRQTGGLAQEEGSDYDAIIEG